MKKNNWNQLHRKILQNKPTFSRIAEQLGHKKPKNTRDRVPVCSPLIYTDKINHWLHRIFLLPICQSTLTARILQPILPNANYSTSMIAGLSSLISSFWFILQIVFLISLLIPLRMASIDNNHILLVVGDQSRIIRHCHTSESKSHGNPKILREMINLYLDFILASSWLLFSLFWCLILMRKSKISLDPLV